METSMQVPYIRSAFFELFFLIVICSATASCSKPSECCNEGRKASHVVNGHSSCLNKLVSISNPNKLCSSLFKVCCWANERDGACRNGVKYFRMFDKDAGFACEKSPAKNTLHGSTFLECCECCQMGKFAALNNQTCKQHNLPVNQKCGQTYQRCCEDYRKAKSGPLNCAEADCDHNCQQTAKGPICSCRNGFKIANNSKTCEDIDECITGTHKCMNGFTCKNLVGTYRCNREILTKKCRKGYKFERGICRDIDECDSGIAKCAEGTVCENVLGNYLCTNKTLIPTCRPGYRAAGVRCVDRNECLELKPCKRGERCVDTYGSYYCTAVSRNCPRGYNWNNTKLSCQDVDECASGSSHCKRDGEECRNTLGSFRCVCKRGYSMKNRRCRDRDECKLYGGKICNHICTNLPGSFRCECKDGFRLARNKRTCLDINECRKRNKCLTGETCFNLPGTHKCIQTSCPRHYQKRSFRSCKLNCTSGLDCKAMPVSIKWFAVSRRGPIKKFGFRLIYDVDVRKIKNVRKVSFKFEKGNEKNIFALQKYGFSRVIIYNRESLRSSRHYHLKIVGSAERNNDRIINFHYNLYIFIYVPF